MSASNPERVFQIILDQGLPRDAAIELRRREWDCDHVSDLGMSRSDDEEIIARARETNAVIVTLDADFHMLVALSGVSVPSVIRVRIEGLSDLELANILEATLLRHSAEIKSGSLISIKPYRTTVRKLPIS